ncbi:hypothetical protein [Paraburkholderia rhizosphaerae]|uniref:Lipoprotein n=1 Tax=Paraburkholderia rhizosphaerae TaxID=480658 RepID=A0A4R8LX65_9BURK|nr:hypothetical protein [Paraburkholderia rhizosphaerae]TDY51792.1 hypothetical protein BX592_10686 [Paraburkholderia rhizosphaerae]
MRRRIIYMAARAGFGFAIAIALSSCANLHGGPDGPGDCVGPPGFCVPYFGANLVVPDAQPALAYASLRVA